DIQFRNVQVLNNPQITTVTRTAFQFTPTQTGDYVLASRPILFNGFAGQWSEAFAVSVQGNLNTDTNNPDPVTTPVQVSNPGIADLGGSHQVIFKSNDGTERVCEYSRATLDLNGNIQLKLTDLSCLR
ncbi:MAG: hypothetical protein K0U68_15125, partial [Gammaproteobacteria bacterium]|nr:hypothetical protein [Gammaproteobacteria bacterium]